MDELLKLAESLERQATSELFAHCSRGLGGPDLEWKPAIGIAAVYQCAAALRARAQQQAASDGGASA